MLHSAKKIHKILDKETLDLIDSYVEGINDQIASRYILPKEILLFGGKCENFTAIDIIAGIKFLDFGLSSDYTLEPIKSELR